MAKPLFKDEVGQRPGASSEPSKWITLGLPAVGLAIVIVGGLLLASVVSTGGTHNAGGFAVHPIGSPGSSSSAELPSGAPSVLPKAGFDLPAGASLCPSGGTGPNDVVAIIGSTTCDFATAVHDAYVAQGGGAPFKVTDPTTHKWFTTRCAPGTPVVCKIVNNAQILLGAAAH